MVTPVCGSVVRIARLIVFIHLAPPLAHSSAPKVALMRADLRFRRRETEFRAKVVVNKSRLVRGLVVRSTRADAMLVEAEKLEAPGSREEIKEQRSNLYP